jgi:hypothetical protein
VDYYGFGLLGAYAGRPHIEAIDHLLAHSISDIPAAS